MSAHAYGGHEQAAGGDRIGIEGCQVGLHQALIYGVAQLKKIDPELVTESHNFGSVGDANVAIGILGGLHNFGREGVRFK